MFIRILIMTMFLITACTPNPIQNTAPPQDRLGTTEEVSATPVATSSGNTATPPVPTLIASPVIEAGLEKKFTQLAIEDLATRLSVNTDTVKVVSIESIAWPNAALGCPLVDKVYPKGKVPGFRIKLEAGGQTYDYHTDRVGQVILCLNVEPKEPGLR